MIECILEGNAGADDDAAIARLEAALARLGRDVMPPPGWEARVFAAIACDEIARRAGPGPPRRAAFAVSPLFRLPARAWRWGS